MQTPGKSRRPPSLKPGDLAAIAVAPGPAWPDLIRTVWDAGAAVLPVDHRLPPSAIQRLLQVAKPAAIFDGSWWPHHDSMPAGEDVAVAVATSGTTGETKIAALTHDAVRAAVDTGADRIGAGSSDPWLSCLPLGHIGGLLVVLRGVIRGAPVTIHPSFDAEAVAAVTASYVSLVPAMLARLLDTGADLTGFKAILTGGQALPSLLRDRALAAGARIVETYGQTESCGGVVYDGVPLDGTRMRLGRDGQIELTGPTIMRGYLHTDTRHTDTRHTDTRHTDTRHTDTRHIDTRHADTRHADTGPFTADGWLATGDVGVIEDGRLIRAERAGDVIVSGGEKIYPSQVEEALLRHPAIEDAAVAGRDDPDFGRRAVAFIVCPDAILSLEEIRDFVAETLPRYAAPREVVVVPEIPRTPGGKIRRALL